jgi:hypothetical protein
MKIKLYDKWIDDPAGKARSFKTVGKPKKIWIGDESTLIRKIAQVSFGERGNSKQWLVLLTDEDYENALVGDAQKIRRFVKDILNDLKSERKE